MPETNMAEIKKSIPYGIKVITRATAVRWIGWGFAEPLLSVFLFSFAGTYAAAGLLRSVYDIAFILALPIVGIAADRFRPTSLIIIGLIIYMFIGTAYFLAGLLSMVLFVVLARFLNGISYALDALGRDTYIRRNSPKAKLATFFGYFDTVADFWWIAAALVGTLLIKRFEIHELLLLIVPTAIISLLIILNFRRKKEVGIKTKDKTRLSSAYSEVFREVGIWGWPLKFLGIFNFFIAFGSAAIGFFLPIEAYTEGANLSMIMLIAIALVVPTLFGWGLGKWFDKRGASLFFWGFISFGILIGFLTISDAYLTKIIVAFGVGVVLELLSLGSSEMITVHTNPEHFGRVGGIMRVIFDVGSMTGPLAVGILIDWQGLNISFSVLAILMFLLAAVFYFMKNSFEAGEKLRHYEDRYHHKIHAKKDNGVGLI